MDTVSSLISHITLQNQETTTQQHSPEFTTSINQLRSFSTALSAFITTYDELHTHINFINSSINSNLPRHLLDTVNNPNLSTLTVNSNVRLLESCCDRKINGLHDVIVSDQNPNERSTVSTSVLHNCEEIVEVVDVSKDREEIDELKEHAETDGDRTVTDVVPEAVVLELNLNGVVTDGEQRLEEISLYKELEEIDCLMDPEEPDTPKTVEKNDVPMDTSCDDQTVTAVAEGVVLEQKFNGMADNCEQRHENVRTPEILEEIEVVQKPEETDTLKKNKKTGTRKKVKRTGTLTKFARKMQFLCKNMSSKGMWRHVLANYSETKNLREEIAKALKLAKDPGKLVLDSTDGFFVEGGRAYFQNKEIIERKAVVLILECFVMISSDGIEIAKGDQEYAAQAAVDWRKRMIREGGVGHTDEVDARGLLLLISGFGIQDDVFKIEDIMDLVRASNVKGISTALCCSVFLLPKIPEVINLMVKNNLEIEAVDMAYTFGLADMCNTRNILTAYLHNKIKDIQNDSPFQMLDVVKQQLYDLKSIKQCLESHNVDPSVLLPDIKINEKIQNLEKEVNEWKLIQKWKSLENPVQQETKRACFGHENMTHQQKPVDHYGMNQFNQSTQPGTSYFDSDRNLSNSYITNHSASSVYNASAMPETIPGLVPNGLSGGFPGSCDQAMRTAKKFDVSKNPEEIDALKKHAETDSSKKPGETVPEDQTISPTPEAIVSEQNPNGMATNGEQSHESVTTPESLEESNVLNKPEEIDNLMKPEQTDICKNPEETVVLKKLEELDTPMIAEEIVESKKPEEIVPACCDQITSAVPEAIVSEQNPNGMAANCNQSHEHTRTPENHEEIDASKNLEIIDVSKKLEQIDILNKPEEIDILRKPKQTDICKNPKEAVVLKKPEELVTPMIPEELDTSKKPEETVPETSCDQTTPAVSKQNPNRMATNREQGHENVSQKHAVTDISKKPEQTDILKKPEPTDICKNPEEVDTSKKPEETSIWKKAKETESKKKFVVSMLQILCKSMRHKEVKWHVAANLSELSNLRVEVANALRLAEDPAKLVLNSVGKFYKQKCIQFCSGLGPHQDKQNQGRQAAVLILECFVMISSDGIKIAKSEQEYAARAAVDWRKRIIREGGLEQTDEVDARGLLLLISGFGIENHVFKIEDIMALIRASNVKGISTALRCSAFLIPKIPMVIFLMVKNNLEIEAVDAAYTFGLEDMCHTRNILATYLHKKVKEFQNGSLEMLEAMKQHLSDLKSVKQCLESHNVDPSTLLPDFKINEKIQNLEKEVNEWKLIQKRKPLENPIHQEAKRACYGHENMQHQQKPVDCYGMNQFNKSTQLSTECFDSDQNLGNTYITNHSTSSVYVASAMPENIPGSVLNGQAGGFPSPYDQTRHEETVRETSCDQTITVVPEAVVSEQNSNEMATNCDQSHENVRTPESLEEIDVSKNHAVINTFKKPEQTDICKNPEETVVLKKPGEINTSMIPEEMYTSKYLEEIDTSEKPEETLPETSCDETTPAVPEAIVSEQNPNGMASNHEQSHENASKKPAVIGISKKPEQTDICKNPEETIVLKKPELVDICKNSEETGVLKKPEEIDTSKKHEGSGISNGMATNHEQSHENASKKPAVIGISKKPEQIDICINPEETLVIKKPEKLDTSMNQEEIDTSKKPELVDIYKNLEEIDTSKKHEESGIGKKAKETEASKKSMVSELESLCQTMSSKEMKWHVAKHFSEMINLREEIAKALKLSEDPAQLVLNSIGRFFVQGARTFCKDSGAYQDKRNLGRMAAVLILECFVMISSDGIEIAKRERECAARAAVDWRKRMIKEGGFVHTDEVDARGLLLLISGFGIQDHVFKIQDIMDLIRASNVKGISTALCRSVCLIPKIPWVIFLMVKNNLEIEAVDIAYTFGLEDMCHPQDILTRYLHNKVKDFQSASSFQMLEAVEQHLLDLKSVKQCLEYHNVDPSTLLPDFKINEKIQNLENEVNKWKLIQKRKSLENPIHQQTKRACFGHENMPHQQKPIDYYGMNEVNRSTQLGTNHFEPGNNYIANHSASPVYNASAMPENIPSPVPNGQAGGFPGSSDQTVHMAVVQPYGWNGPYNQHDSIHGQAYDSHRYIGPWEPGQLESFPGFPGRAGPSSDLYGFADIVEKECMR